MMSRIFSLNYEGYWKEEYFQNLPSYSGVYTFFECKLNSNNTVSLIKILYIGQADNIKERILTHNKLDSLRKRISNGNELCVNCSPINGFNKDRVEAALIFRHKPPLNDLLKDRFNYDATTINNSGNYSSLDQYFTVYKTSTLGRRSY